MAESSNPPCLMVLTGPRAGNRFVLEEGPDAVLIGSDPSCQVVLNAPGVSPVHARLWVFEEGVTVEEADSPGVLYVNDDRVPGHARLRNGDILWLGHPGEPTAVMIQCVLPSRRPAPVEESEPAASLVDEESTRTLAFRPLSLADVAAAAASSTPDVPTQEPAVDEAPLEGAPLDEAPRDETPAADDAEDALAEAAADASPPLGEPPSEVEDAADLVEAPVEAEEPEEPARDAAIEPPAEEAPRRPAPPQDEWGMEVPHEISEAPTLEYGQPPLAGLRDEDRPVDEDVAAQGVAPDEEPMVAAEPTVALRPEEEPEAAFEPTLAYRPEPEPAVEPHPEAESNVDSPLEPEPTMAYRPEEEPERGPEPTVDSGPEPETSPEPTFDREPPSEPTLDYRPGPAGVFDFQVEPDATMDMRAAPAPTPPSEPEPAVSEESGSTLIMHSYEATVADLPLPPPPVKQPAREEPPARVHEFEEDIHEQPATLVHLTTPEPTLAEAPAVVAGEAATVAIPAAPRPAPVPAAPPPRASAPPPRPPEPPARPTAAAPAPRPSPPRPAAPRSVPEPAAPAAVPVAAPARKSSGTGALVGVALGGLALLAVLGGAGIWYWKSQQAAVPPTPPPTQVAQAPSPLPSLAPEEVPSAAPVEPAPEPSPVAPAVDEEVTIVRSPTPPPSPRAGATPSPARPSPAVAQGPRPGTAAPPPTGPAPEVLRAQQVASHLSQAQAASNARSYDVALAQYEEALKLDPQNAAALAGRTAATAARNASRKKFVAGRTVVQGSGKAKADLTGFDSSDVSVQKAPDFTGRLEFEMDPATVQPGQGYRLRVYLVNEGKKPIKISGMSVATNLNGSRSGGPVSSSVKEVAPQQRALLEELPGQWPSDVSAWSAEAQVDAGKGQSLRNQLTWK
jgi:hypothetical protein